VEKKALEHTEGILLYDGEGDAKRRLVGGGQRAGGASGEKEKGLKKRKKEKSCVTGQGPKVARCGSRERTTDTKVAFVFKEKKRLRKPT